MFKKIVWATDGSPVAERVLPVARALADSDGAKLVVAHVEEIFTIARVPVFVDSTTAMDAVLQATVDELNREGLDAELVLGKARVGSGAQKMADIAREVGADLIVLGSHGQGAVAGLFLGSFTLHLLKVAPCPVLVVPPIHHPAA